MLGLPFKVQDRPVGVSSFKDVALCWPQDWRIREGMGAVVLERVVEEARSNGGVRYKEGGCGR